MLYVTDVSIQTHTIRIQNVCTRVEPVGETPPIGFVMSARMEQLGSHWTDYQEISQPRGPPPRGNSIDKIKFRIKM